MNDILNYVCRGLTASERHLARLTKCVKWQNVLITLLAVGGLGLAKVVETNGRDIQELQRKIKTMEELRQEGA